MRIEGIGPASKFKSTNGASRGADQYGIGELIMRAMVLNEQGPAGENSLVLNSVAVPEPGPGDVRIKVLACGVCRTDLHIVEGDLELKKSPLIPGHQVVGVVDQLGTNVTRFNPGDRVGVPWHRSSCTECGFCGKGLENLCDNARFNGYHANGGFAEYMVAPADFIFPLPDGFPMLQAAPLLCAGIIGFRALRLSNIEAGGILGLYGFGASAHVTIQVAKYWGIKVYVFTRSKEHRKHAEELGAAWTGVSTDTPPGKTDSSIIFAPAGALIPEALRVLKKGGTLALAGIYMSPVPELPYELLYGERTIKSIANSTREDATGLLKLAAEIPIATDVEIFPLEKANEALLRLKRSEIRGAAVLKIE